MRLSFLLRSLSRILVFSWRMAIVESLTEVSSCILELKTFLSVL